MNIMLRQRRLSLALLMIPLMALSACSGSPDETADVPDMDASADSRAADEQGPTAFDDAPPADAAPNQTSSADPSAGRFTSDYSKLSFDDCTVTRSGAEGQGVDYRCPGRGDVALLLHDGDGRYDVDAGVRNSQFQSIGAFNSIGTTIEWRLEQGTPIAVIFRLYDDTQEKRGRSVLAVEKIGSAKSPGCRVAQIAGDSATANDRAREIADQRASNFDCSGEKMEVVGNAL